MRNLRNTVQFLNIIQLEDNIRTFLFSYRVFQDRLDRKKSQQTLLQLTMDLNNKRNLRRKFCINSFSFYLQQEKKNQKAKTPDPVLLNCTTEYLKKGNVNAIFTILDYLHFSQMYPFIKGGFF